MTGVEHLVEQGWAAPDSLGVMGYSYGGLLTNGLITRTNKFKAACSGAGIWNDISCFGGGDNFHSFFIRYQGKAPWQAFNNYWEESAVSRAGEISTPTLIVHGANDRSAPTSQSYELYRALKWIGIPTELLIFPREGHTFIEPSHKLTKVKAEIDWMEYYIRGQSSKGLAIRRQL